MELSWIGFALVFGLVAKKLGQAPLIGFLVAGFMLLALDPVVESAIGWELRPDGSLESLATVGVWMLLFAIGLKLDIPSLLKPHI